jgi:hypothetical protein
MLLFAAALFAATVSMTPQPQVLFALLGGDQDGMALEPITMVTKKRGPCAGCWKLSFADPTQDEGMTEDEFTARYYRHGLKYRALAGGADVGTAIVNEKTDLGCESLGARISPPLPDYSGLAVGSLHVPPRKLVRHEATAEEKKALLALARVAFRQKGVSPALLETMDRSDAISTDLNQDGKRDLIGSFEVIGDKTKEYHDYHHLFLIAMADDAGGYRTEYVWYFRLSPRRNEAREETMNVFDTIDLDEDGTDEVIARTEYYESHDYVILKRSPSGKWTIVYRGGAAGC